MICRTYMSDLQTPLPFSCTAFSTTPPRSELTTAVFPAKAGMTNKTAFARRGGSRTVGQPRGGVVTTIPSFRTFIYQDFFIGHSPRDARPLKGRVIFDLRFWEVPLRLVGFPLGRARGNLLKIIKIPARYYVANPEEGDRDVQNHADARRRQRRSRAAL